jgi:hypothetical protein
VPVPTVPGAGLVVIETELGLSGIPCAGRLLP